MDQHLQEQTTFPAAGVALASAGMKFILELTFNFHSMEVQMPIKGTRLPLSVVVAPTNEADACRTRTAETRDGRIRVLLRSASARLHVERELQGIDGVNRLAIQAFPGCGDFERWWSTDPIRFQHPLLHEQVRRDAADLCELHTVGRWHELLTG